MPPAEFRIFLSAVTSEFGKARDELAADLRSREALLRVQRDFRQEDCSAVVCVIGQRSGAVPPPASASPFAHMLPPGIATASYTQWEFFFARHYRRRLSIYIANDDCKPDKLAPTDPDDATLQQAFRHHLVNQQGLDRSYFSNVDQLCRAVLKEDWPKKRGPKPIVLPYPSIGTLFKGRGEFLRRLGESLARRGQTAIVSQALYGLGGIGKTRAAVEYAWANAEKYNAVLSVVAETPEALRRNLAALAGVLVPTLDSTDDQVRLAAALDWLKANPGWFLILDNVDTPEAMVEAERLLANLAGGQRPNHVVITSRLANFSANVEPLALDVLGVDDAVAFLVERTSGRRRAAADDEAAAREIAVALGRLALALEQAGAYIARHRLTFREYLAHWQSKRAEVLAWFHETITGYPRAVAVTWQTSIDRLSVAGRRMLERLAWLAPERVPESLLDVPVPGAQRGAQEGAQGGVVAEDQRAAFNELADYSLVTRDAEGPFFLVHRLVQDVTRRSLSGNARQRSLIEALGWINEAFPSDTQDVRNWPQAELLAPHARAVTEQAAAAEPEPTTRLMNELAVLLQARALHGEAEPLRRRALAIDEKSYGPDHPIVATHLNNLAQLLQDTNRLGEAEPLMRRALAIDEKGYGPDHPTVAIRLNNLAGLLMATNRRGEAEPLMRRALAIGEKSYGPDHPRVATRLNNLATLLQATNRLDEAEPLMRRALAIDEKSYGPDHPDVARDLNNLARLLQATNRRGEAEPLMRRALAMAEKSYGPDHPTVATCLNNLAQLLQDTNRLDEAEPLLRRHLAIFVEFARQTGHPHPHLNAASANYARLLQAMGRSETDIMAAMEALGLAEQGS